ncbi:MAG TPA: hypothetical protein DCX46_13620 [Bacteroidetes bacterium]|nr:hypothetical protein [Bacteroidota bacterium]
MMINAVWHRSHRMPKNPTPQQRLDWHIAHAKNCGCRELTPSMRRELEKKAKLKSPSRKISLG